MRHNSAHETDLIYMVLLTASLQFQFTGIWGPTLFRVPWQPEVPTLNFGEYSIHNDGDVVSHGDLSHKYSRCRHNGDNVNEDGY